MTRPLSAKSQAPDRHASLRRALIPALALVVLCCAGSPYYLLPTAERVRHAWHPWLRPSGYVGQTAGIVCFAIFAFLWLYPLRKRAAWLAFTGPVAKWLDVHITVGVLLPLIGAVHASWNFGGLIGLGYAAMCVVVLSGLVGRYLYMRIPRRRNGLELTRDEVASDRRELITSLSLLARLPPAQIESMLAPPAALPDGLVATVTVMIRDDFARRRAARRLVERVREEGRGEFSRESLRELLALARKEMALAQQIRLLDQTYAVFRFWHAAHKPVAISAFVAVAIHVGVVTTVGATWFW
ncbi:MAG: hypothetical protein HY899_07465 [Deltaproteobacteria bacterium]|nr:hypothetical protein [Deltaproteobacteria bacterium]